MKLRISGAFKFQVSFCRLPECDVGSCKGPEFLMVGSLSTCHSVQSIFDGPEVSFLAGGLYDQICTRHLYCTIDLSGQSTVKSSP